MYLVFCHNILKYSTAAYTQGMLYWTVVNTVQDFPLQNCLNVKSMKLCYHPQYILRRS